MNSPNRSRKRRDIKSFGTLATLSRIAIDPSVSFSFFICAVVARAGKNMINGPDSHN